MANSLEDLLDPTEEHKLVVENRQLKQELRELKTQAEQDATLEMLWRTALEKRVDPPKWLTPKRAKKHAVIPTAFLSDTHFDEVVNPTEINFVNAYSREIAEMRLQKFGENTIKLCRDHLPGFEMPKLILPLGGDMIGGNIHEELKTTNADHIMGTVHHWIGQMIALIDLLLTHFEAIHIPCVVGNHGRNSRKPVAKGRVRDNFDWLMYKQIEFHYHGTAESRKRYSNLSFDISEGTDCRYTVYNTRYQLTHGDQFRGGQGWGGVAVPIMKGQSRKQEREAATNSPFDIMLLGHWHQLLNLARSIVNGSLKGYDEYAALNNFAFEPPRQAFFLTDPKHGVTFNTPIHVLSDNEGWQTEPKVVEVA